MRLPTDRRQDWGSEALPIHLRCYTRSAGAPQSEAAPLGRKPRAKPQPNDMVLIFDTETTIDATQRLRVLFYQLRISGRLDEEGAAYDPGALKPREIAVLRAYCVQRDLTEPITLDAFREEVFLGKGYDCGAEIVGFNLPFDLARIALDASVARVTKYRRKMRDAFTFKLSPNSRRPNVQVKHLSARASVIEFTAEYQQRSSRPDRKRDDYVPVHRGHFTDVKTLAAALTSRSHSLKSLTASLGTKTKKDESDEHGGPLTFAYLDYARSDVQATWECFTALRAKFRSYCLGTAHWEILSEASLGKATLSALGVQSWLAQNANPSPHLLAQILCSYFGGRTEVRWRKTVKEVFHTDFTSMYPSVCTLQGLWRFITATGFATHDATADTQALLESVTADDLQDQALWLRLPVLVRVRPSDDLLPVRAPYCREKNATIGLNYLAADSSIWVTLADCIAGKILSGKTPAIEEAIGFTPGPMQAGLKSIKLFGRHRFDPRSDDLFRRLIQLRIEEKGRAAKLIGAEREAAEDVAQSLKITANSTSYGIFVQVNVETEPSPVSVEVFGPDGESFVTKSRKVERPGPYFNPLLATLITGAARLMLALAESRAVTEGLDWVFCDTDSLALARPEGMAAEEFEAAAERVIEWFRPLDPYDCGSSILKAERANYAADDGKVREPLFCLAISSKRYVLFNIGSDGKPQIRKGSAHGLGHLRAPYRADDPAPGTPASVPLGEIELPRWQHDLWYRLVENALADRLNSTRYDYHPKLRRPALSRYAATNPGLWRWFATLNEGKPYADQVKPFGFLYALHTGRKAAAKSQHPIAPFDRSPELAVRKAFDRVTGDPIAAEGLQTYAEALAGYHMSPESKFRGGEAFDQGRTERRHVQARGFEFIGKEADRYEEAFLVDAGSELPIRYGSPQPPTADLQAALAAASAKFGDAAVGRAIGLPRSTVAKLKNGKAQFPRGQCPGISDRLRAMQAVEAEIIAREGKVIEGYRDAIQTQGSLRAAAHSLGIDPSNLSRRLRRLPEI